jgi:mannose-1-phosphate guanylyltransferase
MLHAVIMAGGSGTRFWPRSRQHTPKQFLSLIGKKALLRQALDHLSDFVPYERIYVITGERHVARTHKLLQELPAANIFAEPLRRDTAACLGLAAIRLEKVDGSTTMIALPADHFIRPAQKLQQALHVAAESATRSNNMTLLGLKPRRPAVEFGYIQRGKKVDEVRGVSVYHAAAFKEKPPLEEAKKLFDSGDWLWNSGIFAWSTAVLIDAFRRHAPDLYAALVRMQEALGTQNEWDTIRTEYSRLPRISIDYAVLEKAGNVAVTEASFEWSDVGTWNSLADFLARNKHGNIILGRHCGIDTSSCVILSEDHLVATVGVTDMVIVHTKDATLVCPRERAAEVRKLVETMEREGLEEYL